MRDQAAGGGDPDSRDTIRKSETSDGVNLCVEFTKEQAAGGPFLAKLRIENKRAQPVGVDQISHFRITIRKKVHLERRRTITLEIKNLALSLREPNRGDWARWRDEGQESGG